MYNIFNVKGIPTVKSNKNIIKQKKTLKTLDLPNCTTIEESLGHMYQRHR